MSNEIHWVKINVTAEHIENGEQTHCQTCPVALAINEMLAPSYIAFVECEFIEVRHRGLMSDEIYSHPLNGDPTKRIECFDENQGMQPFSFLFPLPAHVLKPEVVAASAEEWREHLERLDSKSGLSKQEEFEQAVMRG